MQSRQRFPRHLLIGIALGILLIGVLNIVPLNWNRAQAQSGASELGATVPGSTIYLPFVPNNYTLGG